MDLIPRGNEYGDTLQQFGVRLTRLFNLDRGKLRGMFDVYNVSDTDAIGSENTTCRSLWRRPIDIIQGRLVKVGVQLDF